MDTLASLLLRALQLWWRGLLSIGALIVQPLHSARLIAGVPRLFRQTKDVLDRMYTSGIAVQTPDEQPLLRTTLTSVGDVTTAVQVESRLTAQLATQHMARVRAELHPLRALADAQARLQGLVALVIALLSISAESADTSLRRFLTAAVISLAVSFLFSLIHQLVLHALMRTVRERVGPVASR